jgi:hypothetical protein
MAAAIRRNYCGQLALSHRYRNVGYSSVSRILLLDSNPTRWQCPQTRALPVFTNNGTCAGPSKIDAKDPFRTFPCLLAFRPGLPKLHTARPKSAIGFWSGHILAMRGCRRRVRGRNRVIARRRAAHAGLSAQEPEPLGKARWRRVITSGHNGLRPRKCFGCLFSAPASCRAERRLWRG